MRLNQLSDATIEVTLAGIPDGATVVKCYLGIKLTEATPDEDGLVIEATPSGSVVTFAITNAETAVLAVGKYVLAVKAILDDGRAMRLSLRDSTVYVRGPGIEEVT